MSSCLIMFTTFCSFQMEIMISVKIANGKRFIAYEIVRRLEQKGCNNILMLLKEGVSEKQPGKGQRHKVFEESFDAKPVYHRKFPEQKINYTFKSCTGKMETG